MRQHPHVASFETLLCDRLPAALAELVAVVDYAADKSDDDTWTISLTVRGQGDDVTARFGDVPGPRADGSFLVDDKERTVRIVADRSDLEHAEIRCVGEQIFDEIEPRLVAPPKGAELTPELLRAWLPLGKWITEFLRNSPTSSVINDMNWLARETDLRRIVLPDEDASWHPSHIGRACPFETPEGPNCGRILAVALGAEIRDGRIVVRDASPGAALGLGASMVPLLEHNAPTRQLMGVGMMRQWIQLGDHEPALVQSGNEPDDEAFWVGRNFLTAFIHWKGLNYEDGIVVSESAAERLTSPEPLQIGDKLSNRHGAKGVVSAILPDDEMPHLPDGRPVELIFDFVGMHTRCNFGQIWEAVLGNVAHATGEPVIAAPFEGPAPDAIREMLGKVGLPESGQMQLTDGRNGPALTQSSTVGCVYWGKLYHRSRAKLVPWLRGALRRGQYQGELERYALRASEAYETILETFCTRSLDRPGIEALPDELSRGPVEQAVPPSPAFEKLRRQLRTAGISMVFEDSSVRFEFAEPGPEHVELATPLSHPWCPEHTLTHLGRADGENEAYTAFVEANRRATQSLRRTSPDSARQAGAEGLARAVQELLNGLPVRDALRAGNQVAFSARAVLAPGLDLKLGQIGIPEEMAWVLFEPLVARQIGKDQAASRGRRAREALETAMAENVVLMDRAPTWAPTNITAFCPVLRPGPSIRLHPLCCRLFNGDFDGDQAAIFLPVTHAAQQEAKEGLMIEGHLKRDPGAMIGYLTPEHAILLGLAYAASLPDSREELLKSWPAALPALPERLTRAWLMDALAQALESSGAAVLLETLDQLLALGTAAATRSGASIHPFIGTRLSLPTMPSHRYPYAWMAHCDAVESAILSQAGVHDPDVGPQVLAIRSGARGSIGQLRQIIGPRGALDGLLSGGPVVTGGLRDGIAPEEHLASIGPMRRGLQAVASHVGPVLSSLRDNLLPRGDSLLARALRSDNPGQVFAAAALKREVDPLTDPDVRLFVGLRPEASGQD